MDNAALARRLLEMAHETGSLNCLGCGYEHSCSIHGCTVLKQAADNFLSYCPNCGAKMDLPDQAPAPADQYADSPVLTKA